MDNNDKPKNEFREDIESYLKENINILHTQLNKNEELYAEVKEIFDDQRKTPTFGNLKSVTEIANTLSKIRSTGIDAADRLFKAKTQVLTLEQNSRKLKQDAENRSESDLMMAKFNEFLNSDPVNLQNRINELNSKQQKHVPSVEDQIDKLNNILEEKFSTGTLKHTNNDKLAFEKYNNTNNVKKEEIDYE